MPQVLQNKALILSRNGNDIDYFAAALCALVSRLAFMLLFDIFSSIGHHLTINHKIGNVLEKTSSTALTILPTFKLENSMPYDVTFPLKLEKLLPYYVKHLLRNCFNLSSSLPR